MGLLKFNINKNHKDTVGLVIKVYEGDLRRATDCIVKGWNKERGFDPYGLYYDDMQKAIWAYKKKTGKTPEEDNTYPIAELFYSGLLFEDVTEDYKKGNIPYEDIDWFYDYSEPDMDQSYEYYNRNWY